VCCYPRKGATIPILQATKSEFKVLLLENMLRRTLLVKQIIYTYVLHLLLSCCLEGSLRDRRHFKGQVALKSARLRVTEIKWVLSRPRLFP
jgi:hypothetical protein